MSRRKITDMKSWLEDFQLSQYNGYADQGTSMPYLPPREKILSTSKKDPLKIDWIDDATLEYVGGLGMTMCPGRTDSGMLYKYKRSLTADLEKLKSEGTTTLVTLVEEFELQNVGVGGKDFFQNVKGMGLKAVWYPIRDMGAPNMKQFRPVINRIVSRIRTGERVVFHCRAGLGRAGLACAATLIEMGYSADFAIECVRGCRGGTIQTLDQERFLERLERL